MQKLTSPLAAYSHVRQVGPLTFVAGQGSRDPENGAYVGVEFDALGKITHHDITAQTQGVLRNVELALNSVGLNRSHIVDVTVFLTDMHDFPGMNAVWNEFFAECPTKPTRTTVAVVALPGYNFVEMKTVAAATK